MKEDLLFKNENFIFSHRVGGILIYDEYILLQRLITDDGYSVPGGQVRPFMTAEETLVERYKDELQVDIAVDRLVLFGENFFQWKGLPTHQVALYYKVHLEDDSQIPLSGTFYSYKEVDRERVNLVFTWLPLRDIRSEKLYPGALRKFLSPLPSEIKYFVDREK